ncbi:MAG: helix-turn-helix domain-containing protein [Deltaproteobacteria bacterium]
MDTEVKALRERSSRSSKKPVGRDEIVEAVLDAAERCIAEHGPAQTSLREIAREAGITYSLVGRHFGNREALLEQLIARYEARWEARLGDERDPGRLLQSILGETEAQGTYLRLLAWALLLGDGRTQQSHASALQRLGQGSDPERAAADLAQVFGWRFFGPFIAETLRLDGPARQRVHDAIGDRIQFRS